MKASDVIIDVLKKKNVTHKQAAEVMGMNPNEFGRTVSTDTFTAREFFDLMDYLRVTVVASDDSGRDVTEHVHGILPRISMVVDHIRYDTEKADALFHVSPLEGWDVEFYRSFNDLYFAAVEIDIDPPRRVIIPVSKEHAERAIELYSDTETLSCVC